MTWTQATSTQSALLTSFNLGVQMTQPKKEALSQCSYEWVRAWERLTCLHLKVLISNCLDVGSASADVV